MQQKTIKKYIAETKKKMISLNTYKPEYDENIKVYATLLYQYDLQFDEYEQSGFMTEIEYVNGNGIETSKPNPLIKILESLRKDIKLYSDALCLNPKSNNIRADTAKVEYGKIAVLSKYAQRKA